MLKPVPIISNGRPPPVPDVIGLIDEMVKLNANVVALFIVANPFPITSTPNAYVPTGPNPKRAPIAVGFNEATILDYFKYDYTYLVHKQEMLNLLL